MHPNISDYNKSVKWAKSLFLNKNDWVILDTETSGIENDDVVIQVGILSSAGDVLLDSYVKPVKDRISPGASNVHGITMKILKDAPRYQDIYEDIQNAVKGKNIVAYNAEFDKRLMLQTAYSESSAPLTPLGWVCAMEQYARFVGEWNSKWQNYKYQKLPSGDHTAIGDCRATLTLLNKMAQAIILII